MFQGEARKVGRGSIGANECGHNNDCEDDKRGRAPGWALRLRDGVLRV